jgi:selenide,water dikinase
METADDAGVYVLTDEIALIQTLDFFTPIVNDPYTFGQIAAANALSDVYAMGGRPLIALNIVCYPSATVPKEARPGDRLLLTKPLGTGIVATAAKGRVASPEAEAQAAAVMTALNRTAAECLEGFAVHAVTDITGFGLLGHALEMATGSKVGLTLYASRVPVLEAAREYAAMGLVPAGTFANRTFCGNLLQIAAGLEAVALDLLADAQTNGGLLIAVAQEQAEALLACLHERGVTASAIIGEVTASGPGTLRLER